MSQPCARCCVCDADLSGKNEREISDHIDECLTKSVLREEANARQHHQPAPSLPNTKPPTPSPPPPPPPLPPPRTKPSSIPPPPPMPSLPSHRKQLTSSDIEAMLLFAQTEQANQAAPLASQTSSDPFQIVCPYPACKRSLAASFFAIHVNKEHLKEANQSFGCPICELMGISFIPNAETSLLKHLQIRHSDLPQNESCLLNTVEENGLGNEATKLLEDAAMVEAIQQEQRMILEQHEHERMMANVPIVLGDGREETTLTKTMDKECTICFEQFLENQTVITFECLCVFHKKCIEKWREKSGSKACPLHKKHNDDDDGNDEQSTTTAT